MAELTSGPESGPQKLARELQGFTTIVPRLILGLLFLTAGLPKTQSIDSFAISILNYDLLPSFSIPAAASYLPWFEVVLGLALLLGIFTRAAAAGAALLSLIFALAITSAIYRRLEIDCGCFAIEAQADWPHVLLNVACLALALFLMTQDYPYLSIDRVLSLHEKTTKHWKRVLTLSFLLLALNLLIGWQMTTFNGSFSKEATRAPSKPMPTPSAQEHRSLPGTTSAQGNLTFDPPILDLGGGIMQGDSIVAEATYTNTGDRPLTIQKIGTNCGCTDVEISHSTLQPGEKGNLTLNFRADDSTGELVRGINFVLEGQAKSVTYLVEVEVEPIALFLPDQLLMKPGETRLVRLERQQEGKDFQILKFESPDPEIVVSNLKQMRSGLASFEVTLTEPIKSQVTKESFSVVLVHTNFDKVPVFRFLVKEAKP